MRVMLSVSNLTFNSLEEIQTKAANIDLAAPLQKSD